jgi:hypothetical protein
LRAAIPTTFTMRPPPWETHLRKHRPRHADIAQELEAPARHPFVIREREEIAALDGARVVDEDVEPSQPLHGSRGGTLDAVEAAQVFGDELDPLTGLAPDGGGGRFEIGRAPRTDHHTGALGRHGASRRAADTLAAAGDENRLSLEP